MRALVTGAGGFVGSHLCRQLDARGIECRRVSRQAAPGAAALPGLEASEAQLAGALEGVDVVYFLAGIAHEAVAGGDPDALQRVNVDAPVRWLRAADRAEVRRFVWLSSIKVLGERAERPLRPEDPPRPGDAYARSKAEAERRLLDESRQRTALALVRPPLVYGPGVRGNFAALLRLAAGRWPLPLGRATAPRSLVAVDNLCDLLIRLGDAGEGMFHVADDRDLSAAELVRVVRGELGRPAGLVPVPAALLRAGCRLAGRPGAYRRLFEPLRVCTAATRERLGWAPPQAPQAALAETVAWYRTSR